MTDDTRISRAKDGDWIQRRPVRKREWTAAKRKAFLEHLSATCNVRFSVAQVGMSDTGAYMLRQRDARFRDDWAAALEAGYARLETMLLARAGGTSKTIPADGGGGERSRLRESPGFEAGAHLDLTEDMDSALALQLLALHHRGVTGGPARRRTSRTLRRVTPEEMEAAILKQLSALGKREGGQG